MIIKPIKPDKFWFGKHKGKTFEEVADIDPGYIIWAYENLSKVSIPRALYNACIDEDGDPDDRDLDELDDWVRGDY